MPIETTNLKIPKLTDTDNFNTTTFGNIVDAIDQNAVSHDEIGLLSGLETSEQGNLVGAINEVQQEVVAHLADDTAHDIGDKTTLLTTDKSSIVGAINEAFQFANDGKTAVANAVAAKGVSASPSDTFSVLANKIGLIPVGDYAIGDFIQPESLLETFGAAVASYAQLFSANASLNTGNSSVAIDQYGNTYTIDVSNRYLYKFDSNGTEIWRVRPSSSAYCGIIILDKDREMVYSLGSSGHAQYTYGGTLVKQNSNLKVAGGVTIDKEGFFYTSLSNGNIDKRDNNGGLVWTSYTGLGRSLIGVGISNNYVCTLGEYEGVISIFNKTTGAKIGNNVTLGTGTSTQGTLSKRVAGDSKRNCYYVATNAYITKVYESYPGTMVQIENTLGITSLSVDEEGNVLASGTNTLVKYDSDLNVIWSQPLPNSLSAKTDVHSDKIGIGTVSSNNVYGYSNQGYKEPRGYQIIS